MDGFATPLGFDTTTQKRQTRRFTEWRPRHVSLGIQGHRGAAIGELIVGRNRNAMRRVPLILGLVLITGLIIHDIYEFIVTNEGIRYFSSEPIRLAYVVLLGVAGGMIALGISRLSPASQRRLKLFALGAFGLFLIGAAVFAGWLFYSVRTAPIFYGGAAIGWMAFAGFIAAALAAGLVLWEFSRVWRHA